MRTRTSIAAILLLPVSALAAPGTIPLPSSLLSPGPIAGPSGALQLALLLSVISLLPAIVLSCTCFARFIIALSFLKAGLATQGAPPTQILVGLALFLTAFVMAPVATQVHQGAIAPYMAGKLDESGALEAATPPIRTFLLKRTRQADLALFYDASRTVRPANSNEVPLRIAVPAYMLSELRTSYEIGLVILLPFLVIDLVIATVLSSLGLMMLPPSTVALPVKLLVFIAADGWHLIMNSLLLGVNG